MPDGRARLVSEIMRALRVVLGRPRGLGRVGLEGLGWHAWELSRSAGLRGESGKEELGWVAWVEARLGFPFFQFFSFSISNTTQIYLNSKPNLNSKPYALNQRKLMHQHECTNMFKPREILITRERKFN